MPESVNPTKVESSRLRALLGIMRREELAPHAHVVTLAKELDDIIDMLYTIVNRMKVYKVAGANKNLVEFASVIGEKGPRLAEPSCKPNVTEEAPLFWTPIVTMAQVSVCPSLMSTPNPPRGVAAVSA